jgi:hypothetical protein
VRHAVLAEEGSCGLQPDRKSKVAAYCMARISTRVSRMGRMAWLKATQPASCSGHFGQPLALQADGQRADRIDVGKG